ncbi:MAG: hypothetical protein ABI889_04820 [Gemmatimonadota bacterium]
MRSLPMLLLAGILASSLAAGACAPSATIPSKSLTLRLTQPRQIVRVSNHGWDEVELSAIRGGSRRVLGTISAAQQATLVVSEDMLDTDGRLQLAARVQGKPTMTLMQPLRVPSGNYVDWSLENDIGRSTVDFFPL